MWLLPAGMFAASFGLVMLACMQEKAGPLSAFGVLLGICAIVLLVVTSGAVQRSGPEAP